MEVKALLICLSVMHVCIGYFQHLANKIALKIKKMLSQHFLLFFQFSTQFYTLNVENNLHKLYIGEKHIKSDFTSIKNIYKIMRTKEMSAQSKCQ